MGNSNELDVVIGYYMPVYDVLNFWFYRLLPSFKLNHKKYVQSNISEIFSAD